MATTTASKATTAPKVQPIATGTYKANTAWQAAHGAAVGAQAGNPLYKAAVQVATHLAWRTPSSAVAWYGGTNGNMVAHANTLGITPGMPQQAAMHIAVQAAVGTATTQAQHTAAAQMAALVGPLA